MRFFLRTGIHPILETTHTLLLEYSGKRRVGYTELAWNGSRRGSEEAR
jgi:hypothetical protein